MEEKKEQVLKILQDKVKGYVKIDNDKFFGGWYVTINYCDFAFGVIIFEENIRKYTSNVLVKYVLENYKNEINDYYFK